MESFKNANLVQKHDICYQKMTEINLLKEDFPSAVELLSEAVEISPENVELQSQLGVIYMRQSDQMKAF